MAHQRDAATALAEPAAAGAPRDVKILKSVCRSCHGGCGVKLHVARRQAGQGRGRPRVPAEPRASVPDRHRDHRPRLPPGSAEIPDAPHRGARRREVGAHHLGRGARRRSRASCRRSRTSTARRPSPWAPAPGATTSAGCRASANALGTPNWCEPGFAQCFHPRVNISILTMGDLPVNDFTSGTQTRVHRVLGAQPDELGPRWRDALRRARGTRRPTRRPSSSIRAAPVWRRRPTTGCSCAPGTDDALALAMLNTYHRGGALRPGVRARLDARLRAAAPSACSSTRPNGRRRSPGCRPSRSVPRRACMPRRARRMMEWGCAIEHTPNCIQTVRAISMLPALTGNVDVPGGWVLRDEGAGPFPEPDRGCCRAR